MISNESTRFYVTLKKSDYEKLIELAKKENRSISNYVQTLILNDFKGEIKMDRYIIRDREAGNKVESFETLVEAQNTLKKYEKDDKKEGIYEENFYEIYDSENEVII